VCQVSTMAGRPLFRGLAVLCAICMMSMIIMDRMSRVNVVLFAAGYKDSQDAIFSDALKSARQQEAQFTTNPKSSSQPQTKPNPYLSAAKDLETAGAESYPIHSQLFINLTLGCCGEQQSLRPLPTIWRRSRRRDIMLPQRRHS
jgi:hypothetical protein